VKNESSDTVHRQILSTFKFTPSTADWKTYTDTANAYSIKYPSTYTVNKHGAYIDIQKTGTMERSALQAVTVSTITATNLNTNTHLNLYTWAKNGFSKTAALVVYHNNPREVHLGNSTFIRTDGDQGSSGIPEYFIFHQNILYQLTALHGTSNGSENEAIISTLTFTK
jgi:hypothetical protein